MALRRGPQSGAKPLGGYRGRIILATRRREGVPNAGMPLVAALRRGHDECMRPMLVVNPRSDFDFNTLVEKLVEQYPNPEALQRALREIYPKTSVRVRELSGEGVATWYVYREGRWTAND